MSKANAIWSKPTPFMSRKEDIMTQLNHLHPSLTEPLSAYRSCDVPTLLGQIPETVKRAVSSGVYKRVVSVGSDGEYTPVGVLFPLVDNYAVRVLYTYFDLYEVQLIKINDEAMLILDACDGIFADQLGEMVLNAAAMWAAGRLS